MSATKVDIEITQGETFRLVFRYLTEEGVPISFAGQTFAMAIRADLDSPVLATLTSQNGKVSWDAELGEFVLSLSATETLKLKLEDVGVYDLFAKSANGTARRFLYGDITFIRAVTR